VQYSLYTPLNYSESLRSNIVAAAEGGLKVVKAPMPCKILKVLKKVEEEVKKGEVLMVVESMKMEMSISAPEDGVFGTERAEGQAVEEGSVLCEVD
jgi:biotin carboxyl carrier protein